MWRLSANAYQLRGSQIGFNGYNEKQVREIIVKTSRFINSEPPLYRLIRFNFRATVQTITFMKRHVALIMTFLLLTMALSACAGSAEKPSIPQFRYTGEGSASQQQAGNLIRRMPENTPALRDEKLNGFLEALMEAAWSIDTSRFSGALAGKAGMMETALRKAADADRNDPYAVYEAAATLAKAYDRLLEESE